MDVNGGEQKEKKNKVELIEAARQQLMDVKKQMEKDGGEQEDEQKLSISELVSQLESSDNDSSKAIIPKDRASNEDAVSSERKSKEFSEKDERIDEVMKELRRVKRQNVVTHCLLTTMIIVTVFWQFSELSLVLMVKKKVSNPLKSLGDFIKSRIGRDDVKIETAPLPPVQVPELPHVDLPHLTFNGRRRDSAQHDSDSREPGSSLKLPLS